MLIRSRVVGSDSILVTGALVNQDVRTLYLKDLSLLGGAVLEPEAFPNLIRTMRTGGLARW
jgi:hypothetical protein